MNGLVYFPTVSTISFEDALAIANAAMQATLGRHLSDIETLIFEGSWQGKTYPQIADEADYSINYLTTDVGPKFWKALSQALGEPVNKKNFKSALKRRFAQTKVTTQPHPANVPLRTPPTASWGEAPDVSQFYGRDDEQAILHRWIDHERCRLIAILGMGGMGKSALATKVAEAFATVQPPPDRDSTPQPPLHSINPFTHILWRSLRNAPSLSTLLTDLIDILSDHRETESERSRLLYWLREKRCLIVLDNMESILQAGDHAGYYREGYEDYGDLIRLLGETIHQSCVVITSREKPAEIAALEGFGGSTRTFQLSGSISLSLAIIAARNLQGTDTQRQLLCDRYSYNPLALKIVSTTIQDVFVGDITAFLAEETVLFNGIRYLLAQQFERLSALEQSVMYWLVINRNWTTIAELAADIVPATSRTHLLEALESLSWRSLIEKRPGSYALQSVVMEYVGNRLVEQISTELITGNLDLSDRYPLLKTTVNDYVRDSQIRLLIKPVADNIYHALPKTISVEQHFRQLLTTLRETPIPFPGYGVGTIINLCVALQIDLSSFDFSNLTIQHAYLPGVTLQETRFQGASFHQSVFTETLGSVLVVTYSPDGTLLAVGDNNGQVRLYASHSWQCVAQLSGHENWIWTMAFSPDGQFLAVGSTNSTIHLWDVNTCQCIRVLQGHEAVVYNLSWHPNGMTLASSGQDQMLKLWDVRSGICLRTLPITNVGIAWVVAWHPNGATLASSGNDYTIRLWDTATWDCMRVLSGHDSWVLGAAWHPNGQWLATCSSDYQVKLWDVSVGTCLMTLPHDSDVWAIALSPDGQTLASGTHGHGVKLWDLQTGQCCKNLTGHRNWVWSVAWSPDGKTLASGSHDQTVRLWDVATGQCLKTLQGYSDYAWSMAWSRDGRRLLSSSTDYFIKLWDARSGQCLTRFQGHTNWVWAVVWSPDEQMVASGSVDQTIRLWDVATGQCQRILRGHRNAVWSVAWQPQSRILASGSHDQTIKLWDTETGQCLRTLEGHTHFVSTVIWSPDGQQVISAGHDGRICIWDVHTGECIQVLQINSSVVYSLSWQPGGDWLASGHFDHSVRLWNVQTGICVKEMVGHQGNIYGLAWSPDGNILASGGTDKTIKLWHPITGQCLHSLEGHTGWTQSLAWHPEGTLLASGGDEHQIWLWNTQTQSCERVLRSDRLYEGMNITDVQGLTIAQKATLKTLGAIEQ